MAVDGEMIQSMTGHPRSLEFLLSVGADPNACPDLSENEYKTADVAKPDGFFFLPYPLLLAIALISDESLATQTCEMLLTHKADPTLRFEGNTALQLAARAPAMKVSIVEELMERVRTVPRPACQCPCGSERTFTNCHERTQLTGVPLHPSALCPCHVKNKKYGSYDLKKGLVWYETLSMIIEHRKTLYFGSTDSHGQIMQTGHLGGGEAMQRFCALGQGRDQIVAKHKARVESARAEFVTPLIQRCFRDGACHPAFAFAAERCDFHFPRPWRNNNQPILPKVEMEKRQQEWNDLVDAYTATHMHSADAPVLHDVEVAATISWTGGPLYNTCGYQGCTKLESLPSEFMLCSKCKQTRSCSRKCFKKSWRAQHKHVCGTDEAEPMPMELSEILPLCDNSWHLSVCVCACVSLSLCVVCVSVCVCQFVCARIHGLLGVRSRRAPQVCLCTCTREKTTPGISVCVFVLVCVSLSVCRVCVCV